MYRITNKTFQTLQLVGCENIPSRSCIYVKSLTDQIKNLEKRGLVDIKKQ